MSRDAGREILYSLKYFHFASNIQRNNTWNSNRGKEMIYGRTEGGVKKEQEGRKIKMKEQTEAYYHENCYKM